MLDRSAHVYHKLYVVWGRKPLEGEVVPPAPAQNLPRRPRKDTVTEPPRVDNPVPFGPAPKRPKFGEEPESLMAIPVDPGAVHSEPEPSMAMPIDPGAVHSELESSMAMPIDPRTVHSELESSMAMPVDPGAEPESSMAMPIDPGAVHSELAYTVDDGTTNH
jgi:hypothetical protein